MHYDILLVDDDPVVARVMGQMLLGIGQPRYAADGREAIAQVRRGVPDLILLDAEMPDMHGFDLCRVIKGETALAKVPIIFVTAHREQEFEVRALECGASDFIAKPVNPAVLRARVNTHLAVCRLTQELREQTMCDGVTGLPSRRAFDMALSREWRRAQRDREAISVIEIDVDHFRSYNELYGRPSGDSCLREIGSLLASTAQRPADYVARLSGPTFAMLLPQTPRDGAMTVAERVMEAIDRLAMPHSSSPVAGQVTVSIGVASHNLADPTFDHSGEHLRGRPFNESDPLILLRNADRAMQKAKQSGRARIAYRDGALPLGGPGKRRTGEPGAEPAPAATSAQRPVAVKAAPMPSAAATGLPDPSHDWPHIAGIDWEQSRRRLAGNRDLLGTMLRRLVSEFEVFSTGAVDEDDDKTFTARLHKLKGSAGTLGAVDLEAIAVRAEQACRAGNRAEASSMVKDIRGQLDLIRTDSALALAG